MSLTATDMCMQIGRYLERQTGKAFVEPESSEKGTIYGIALPDKAHRLNPAVSIVPQPSATDEPMDLTDRMTIVMHAQGKSNQIVMRLLGEFQRILWPNNRPTVLTEGTHKPGIIGVPVGISTHDVWRMIDIRQLSHPQISPRSVDGFAQAEFAFEVHAVETTATNQE